MSGYSEKYFFKSLKTIDKTGLLWKNSGGKIGEIMIKKVLFFRSDCLDAYKNIALEYRFVKVCPHDAVIVYVWQNDHSVIIGKNQNAFGEVNLDLLLADGGKVVRRFTGGGAVYHDIKNLNFSFVASKENYSVEKDFKVIKRALEPFGVNAEISGRNDLTVDGKKFSGNAFLTEDGICLHHGTILIDTDVTKMQKYLTVNKEKLAAKGVKSVASRVVNLATICPDLTAEKVAESIRDVCGKVFDAKCVEMNPDEYPWDGQEDTEKLLRSNEWTLGRVADKNYVCRSKRFDWGTTQVAFVKDGDGVLTDLLVFSDSLDTEICKRAQEFFIGKKTDGMLLTDRKLTDVLSLLQEQNDENDNN